MVVSQILVEHGHFLRKLLIADKQAQKSSVPPKFEAICHILLEHDHFHFLMEHGHFSNFGTGLFFEKALNCGQVGLKKCPARI